MPDHATTALLRSGLPGAVGEHARVRGDAPALTFLDYEADPDGAARSRSYAELDRGSRAVAAGLHALCPPGSRVAIACPHSEAYVLSFLGCLYAGRIAVPLPGPDAYRGNDRIVSALQDCGPSVLMTTRDAVDQVEDLLLAAGIDTVRVVAVERLVDSPAGFATPRYDPAAVAYLQYTSGSTSDPRGVRVTHANLVSNVDQIASVLGYLRPGSTTVGWVPFFHDMGLVLSLALPLGVGAHTVQMSPTAFIQSPHRWLKAVSDYRAVWTGGPNFAYDLCVDRIGRHQRQDLDLSCLQGLVNGSEAVRDESQAAFVETFAACGLRPDIDGPSYGLAEATLAVTGLPMGDPPELTHTFDRADLARGIVAPCPADAPEARFMVGCGMPLPGIDLRIVDPTTGVEAPADRVGEVWLSGPNVADGYWERPDLSAATFRAGPTDRDGRPLGHTYLRTGDLGFVYGGMLFLAGRRKELIVVDGRNHDPVDVEATVGEALAGHPAAGVAAFAVEANDGERVVVVVETTDRTSDDHAAAAVAVRARVSRRHGVDTHDVAFVPVGFIPRTSSRKVQRGRCREKYLSGDWRAAVGAVAGHRSEG